MLFFLSDYYKLPINHPYLTSLSTIQKTYTVYNIARKKQVEEAHEFDKIKFILTFMDPEKAKLVFESNVETVENSGFEDEIKKRLGDDQEALSLLKMSPKEIEELDEISLEE